ncbi:MAG: transglutaminase domain-containing protein, partial [Myxococcales bacterium]|nr:transglutaminase domain-containing protein [Myxococcales bacterium]
VHFAHAGVFLMRSIGIPTRVATGYAVPESNRQGGSGLVVTGADAHAWPEVYIDGFGWVVTDVSPAKVLSPAPPPPDPDLQRLLAELMRGEKPLADDAQAREDFGAVFRRWFDGAKRFLGGALAGALVFLVLAKIWRALVPLVASKRSRARVTYRAALDRLSELGRRRRIGETREAFARRLSGEFPHFVALTDAHLAEVFGEGAPSDPRPLLRAVVRERRALPFWRRALGTLSPWSWLRTR